MNLRLIFAGSGEFGIPSLRALLDSGHEIVSVYTQPDRPAGRGRALTPTPIAGLASSRNLPLIKTSNINAETLPAADILMVIAFGQKIAEHVVHHPRLGSINLHASLLPKYRGAAPINWAIICGETIAGNSVIRLAPKMDAGAILAQSQLDIDPLETAGELHDRLAEDGAPLIARVLNDLATGSATETPQDDAAATTAPKLSREDSKIDFTRPAVDVANQIRGMYPWPGCRVSIGEATVTLVRARSENEGSEAPPGNITPDGHIACATGAIEILELQPQGKRPMTLAAFRNGHPWLAGTAVTSVS